MITNLAEGVASLRTSLHWPEGCDLMRPHSRRDTYSNSVTLPKGCLYSCILSESLLALRLTFELLDWYLLFDECCALATLAPLQPARQLSLRERSNRFPSYYSLHLWLRLGRFLVDPDESVASMMNDTCPLNLRRRGYHYAFCYAVRKVCIDLLPINVGWLSNSN